MAHQSPDYKQLFFKEQRRREEEERRREEEEDRRQEEEEEGRREDAEREKPNARVSDERGEKTRKTTLPEVLQCLSLLESHYPKRRDTFNLRRPPANTNKKSRTGKNLRSWEDFPCSAERHPVRNSWRQIFIEQNEHFHFRNIP